MFDTLTVRGFAATKPDLRTLPDGTPVSSFRLASTPRRFDAESGSWVDVGPTNWYTVTCFRKLAANAASSLKVGDAVLVQGRLRLRPWTTKDGIERLTVEIDASSLGPDLALGTATYKRSGGHGADASRGDQPGGEREGGEASEDRPDWAGGEAAIDPMTGEVLGGGSRHDGAAGGDGSGQRDGRDQDAEADGSWEGDPDELLAGGGTGSARG